MKRIAIIGSQHGNELLGEQLYTYIAEYEPELAKYVTYKLANPRARDQKVRFIETDMNRSYNGETKTYEERLAVTLLRYLQNEQFDLVIDAHTTTVDGPPCVITASLNAAARAFLRASHIREVVLMQHAFGARSLIGNLPEALSIEISASQLGAPLFAQLCADLRQYLAGNAPKATKNVYTVQALLAKKVMSSESVAAIENFVALPNGTYPVLVGEKAYRDHTNYLGFLANSKEVIEV